MSLRSLFAQTSIASDPFDGGIGSSTPSSTSLIASSAVVIGLLSNLNQQIHDMIAAEDEFIIQHVVPMLRRSSSNQYHALRRVCRQRQSWSAFQRDLTDQQFRRYFRMNKGLFRQLCDRIEGCVGAEDFKSEQFLHARLMSPPKRSNNIYHTHHKSTGGMICGEVKLAVTLRILGGGSYLDMAMIFKSTFNHANKLFVEVVYQWLCHCSFYPIDGIKYVRDEERMAKVATQFAQSSCGIMNGCIGALDGWVVKIKKPTRDNDKVSEPSSFYSRKGYFGLNVQCIVDKQKRVLFRTIKSRGAEHDSTAFKNTHLYVFDD